MKSSTVLLIILAIVLIIAGVVIAAAAGIAGNWTFGDTDVNYETKEYQVSEDFDVISIKTETDDVVFVPSEGGSCKVVCLELEKLTHTVEVENGALVIKSSDTREWYEKIFGISFKSPKTTVYLPKAEYASLSVDCRTGDVDVPADFSFGAIDITASTGDVTCDASASGKIKIAVSTGDISAAHITAESIVLSLSTGDVVLTDVRCGDLVSAGGTGSVMLNSVVASGKLSVESSTGSVNFDRCDAGEIFVKTSTGSVKGTLLSEKVFIASSNTGKVKVPSSTSGGKCEIKTSTGSVVISIAE